MKALATAQHVRLMRRIGAAKPRRRVPKQAVPRTIEREYGKALSSVVARMRGDFAPLTHALPSLLESARASSVRQDAGESRRVRDLIEQARARMGHSINTSEIEALATKFANQTSTYQRLQLGRQVRAALGIDLIGGDNKVQSTLEAFAHTNVSLIKNLSNEVADKIEALTLRAVQDGRLHKDLADELDERFAIGERRAQLIARDQVGKLYGQTNAIRQKDLGVEKFVWRTVEDERVRPEHEARDGETYSYDDPPDGELPGEPILCRCTAEPDFSAILEGAED